MSPLCSSLAFFSPPPEQLRFWDIKTDQLTLELDNPYVQDCGVAQAEYSPDGKLFAVSFFCYKDMSHLLVWDLSTRVLLHDWQMEDAKMPQWSPNSTESYHTVDAFAFFPNSTEMVYASGNTLQIKDLHSEEHDSINLGPKMFASQISFSHNSKVAYVLMDWVKDNDFPAFWTEQYVLQTWYLSTHGLLNTTKYPEGWAIQDFVLLGNSLIHSSVVDATMQIRNLETNKTLDLPYRQGWRFFNSDASYVVYARLFGFEDKGQSIELWNTDNWRNIYTFMPSFGSNWTYGPMDIVFNPDNSMLAIAHEEQVSLWNIKPFTRPQK